MTTKILWAALFTACAAPAFAGDVGVSINVGEPGYYGQIDIGNVPPPQLVYPQPVVIRQGPEFASAPPIYLHVRPGHEKHWREHCAEYNACGRPVYFVRDEWYQNEYVPRHRHGARDHDEDHGHHSHDHDSHDHDKSDGRDEEHGHQDH